jgi:hypothetical protein
MIFFKRCPKFKQKNSKSKKINPKFEIEIKNEKVNKLFFLKKSKKFKDFDPFALLNLFFEFRTLFLE